MEPQIFADARPNRRVVSLRSMLPLISDTATTGWVHAARPGNFEGHPSGPFVFDEEIFQQIKRNFESQRNQVVPLTWDHPTFDGSRPIELAGWVHRLEVRDDGLWAFCEFTEKAVKLVREGSYKFASVVVSFNSKHRESGEDVGAELFELALTSSPFIDGLQAVRLSRRTADTRKLSMDPEKALGAVRKALGLADDATREDMVKALDAVAALMEAQEGEADEKPADEAPAAEASEPPPADMAAASATPADDAVKASDAPADGVSLEAPADMPAEADAAAGAVLAALEQASGLDAAAILAAIQANPEGFASLLGAMPEDGAQADAAAAAMSRKATLLEGTIAKLSARIEALESEKRAKVEADAKAKAEAHRKSVEAEVAELVKAGRILDTQADGWVSLGVESPEQFRKLSATLKPAVPTDDLVTPRPPTAGESDEDDEKESLRRMISAAKVKDVEGALKRILDRRNSR